MNLDNVKRIMLMVMGALVLIILVVAMFHPGKSADPSPTTTLATPKSDTLPSPPIQTPTIAADTATAATPAMAEAPASEIIAILSGNDTVRRLNRFEQHFDSMPPGGVKMKINGVGGYLAKVFNDSNYLHLQAAQNIGITPIFDLRTAWDAGAKVERLSSCREYFLDDLHHSLPFLVPQAHKLLKDIGRSFRDSLAARGGGDYRIKVTSVLRTPSLVKQLRRRNRNAVDTSAHLFATTFDISYAKFICDSVTVPRTQEDMKNLLAEIVYDLRDKGRCHVKYERKQACFHITAR